MRRLVFALAIVSCQKSSAPAPAPSSSAAPPSTATSAAPPASVAPPPSRGAPIALRVYVAGESIERRNRFVAPPFQASGALNDRGEQRNDDDEYGWMIPFADRLRLRDPSISVQWVGAEAWKGADDEDYSGTYPSSRPGATSAISGTSIDSWLEAREAELTAKKHCYDVAFAARGGNDFGLDDDGAIKDGMKKLVLRLAAGSSCKKRPIVYVTAHMPDNQRESGQPIATYAKLQVQRFALRMKGAVDELRASKPDVLVRFVDGHTPFLENRKTTAFPAETWSRGGIPDYAKIGRTTDGMHPRRLASIYFGEIVADAIDLAELRRIE